MQGSVEHLELEEYVPLKKKMTSEGKRPRIEKVLGGAIPDSRAEVSLSGARSYHSQIEEPAGYGEGAPSARSEGLRAAPSFAASPGTCSLLVVEVHFDLRREVPVLAHIRRLHGGQHIPKAPLSFVHICSIFWAPIIGL